ncbi:RNA polymerase sigma factor [Phenylobacterium sp.]|uniref:RNA polymerase sigma factor n=1 Tax=Phenylobacterium sp. TaxID=1871053 RepID=UPI00374CF8A6
MAPSEPSKPAAADSPLVEAFLEKRESLVLFLAARTRSMAMAEDLAQDLYLKIAAMQPGTEIRSPGSLLYRMASNLLVDHVRSAQRARRRDSQWRDDTRTSVGGEEVVEEPSAEQLIVNRERARQLAEAVAGLPPQMGRAFRLNKLEGLTQMQTAEAMGISRKMVEQHIHAAVKNLTRRLGS